jgi:hypothetical protein
MGMSEAAIKRAVQVAHRGADPASIACHGSVVVFEKHGTWFGGDIRNAGRDVPAVTNVVPLGVWLEGERPDHATPSANALWSEPETSEATFDENGLATFEAEVWWGRLRPGSEAPAPSVSGRGGRDYAEVRPTAGWS